jgi:phage FluMu protein Com
MNDIEIIEGILGITPKKETTKERTIVCRICEKDYTYSVKKGRQPTVCKEEACDAARKKGYQSVKSKVVRTHTCLKCDVEIIQHGRGGKKLYCPEHRIAVNLEHRKEFKRPTIVREQGDCKDCGKALGTKTGKGRMRIRCPVCMTKRVYKRAAESRTPIVRIYTCRVCEKEFEQHGQGQTRKKCTTCKYPIKPTKMVSKSDEMLDGMMQS